MIANAAAPRRLRTPPFLLRGAGLALLGVGFLFGAILCTALIAPACCGPIPWVGDSSAVQWRTLAAAWLLTTGLYMALYWRWLRLSNSLVGVAALPLVASLLLTACSWPYLVVADALAGGEPVRYHGVVTDTWKRHERTTLHGLTLRDGASGATVRLRISLRDYERMRIGDRADCRYRRGRIGSPFRWRWDAGEACSYQLQGAVTGAPSMSRDDEVR